MKVVAVYLRVYSNVDELLIYYHGICNKVTPALTITSDHIDDSGRCVLRAISIRRSPAPAL